MEVPLRCAESCSPFGIGIIRCLSGKGVVVHIDAHRGVRCPVLSQKSSAGSDFGHPRDQHAAITPLAPPAGVSPGDYSSALRAADARYCDCFDYDVFPEALPGTGYDSNSYVSGLIRATGGRSICKPGAAPGKGFEFSWVICGDDASAEEFVVAFDVVGEDLGIREESLHFTLRSDGVYWLRDSL